MAAGMDTLAQGQVLDSTYELLAPIGSGGMGTVWRARHLRLPKEVAIKVLNEGIDTGSQAFIRFRREAEIASRLGHPHIVEALDFNTLPSGAPYLVLELLHGTSLRQAMDRGPLELALAAHITRQVASALSAAHAAEVVHRDLKPENIFLCQVPGEPLPHAKILDFGISKIQSSETRLTADGMVFGTPQYMAPEQATGADIGPAADQFALGAIVYEMLAGRSPFDATHPVQVLYQIVHQPPTALRDLQPRIAPEVAAVVHRSLSKAPEERFADVMQLAHELARSAGVPISGAYPGETASPAPPDALGPTAAVPATPVEPQEPAPPAPDATPPAPDALGPTAATPATPPAAGPAVAGPDAMAPTAAVASTPPVAVSPEIDALGPTAAVASTPPEPLSKEPNAPAEPRVASAPTTVKTVKMRPRPVLLWGTVVAVATAVVATLVLTHAPSGRDEPSSSRLAAAPPPTSTGAGTPAAAPPTSQPAPRPRPDAGVVLAHHRAPPATDAAAAKPGRRAKAAQRRRPAPPPLAPELRRRIAEALEQLRRGNLGAARTEGQRLLRDLPHHSKAQAHAILARVSCVDQRLDRYTAHLRQIPTGARRAVKRFCRKHLDTGE